MKRLKRWLGAIVSSLRGRGNQFLLFSTLSVIGFYRTTVQNGGCRMGSPDFLNLSRKEVTLPTDKERDFPPHALSKGQWLLTGTRWFQCVGLGKRVSGTFQIIFLNHLSNGGPTLCMCTYFMYLLTFSGKQAVLFPVANVAAGRDKWSVGSVITLEHSTYN